MQEYAKLKNPHCLEQVKAATSLSQLAGIPVDGMANLIDIPV